MESIKLPQMNYDKNLKCLKRLIENSRSNIILIFHRHLEHDPASDENDKLYKLTNEDLSYVKDIFSLIGEAQLSIAFTVDNLRSYLTSYFILNPEEISMFSHSEQFNFFNKSKDSKNIVDLSKKLSYRDTNNSKFAIALDQAFKDARPLEFLIDESDDFRKKGENISNYSLMVSEVAEIILKYFKIKNKWRNLSEVKYCNKNLFRIFCTREFVYACFRAILTEKVLNTKERNKYVSFFSKNRGAKFTGLIMFEEESKILLVDDFGSLQFNVFLLENMCEKGI